jgi:hypothetical protein
MQGVIMTAGTQVKRATQSVLSISFCLGLFNPLPNPTLFNRDGNIVKAAAKERERNWR